MAVIVFICTITVGHWLKIGNFKKEETRKIVSC